MAGLSTGTKKNPTAERVAVGWSNPEVVEKLHRSLHHACGPGGPTTGHPEDGHPDETKGAHSPIGSGQVRGPREVPAGSGWRMFKAKCEHDRDATGGGGKCQGDGARRDVKHASARFGVLDRVAVRGLVA